MRNILIIIGIIIFSINISLATNIIKGEVYQNHINKVFGTRMTVSLPPGKWEAVKITTRKQYTSVKFNNNIDGAFFYISIPNTIIAGDYFASSGVKKCKNKNDNFTNGLWTGDKYKVHATGLIRNALQTSYCIGDKDNLDGEDWLHIGLHAEKKKGSPLMSAYYDAYYPKKFSNIDSLNKKQLEAIGKSLMKVFKNNVQGKPGDYTMATQLLNFTNTSSSSNSANTSSSNENKLEGISDAFACRKSTSLDGMKWESTDSKFGDYVTEVFRRNLSLKKCRELTERKPSDIKKSTEPKISMDIKNRLKELKSMLDDGLINQDQYDAKSTELLKDF